MPDSVARELARTTFDRPLVVEAGAGTGKTTALVARVLTWVTVDGWAEAARRLGDAPPAEIAAEVLDGVVAITFTEAAAAEMADRIGQGLASLADAEPVIGLPADLGPPADVIAVRCRALLEAIDRLVVSTIHAFCRRILASSPLDAGLHPDLSVDADGSALAEVVYEVVEEQFTTAFGSDSPLRGQLLVLAGQGIGPEQLAEGLSRLAVAAFPASALEADPLAAAHLQALLQRADAALAELLGLVSPQLFGVQLRVPVTEALEAALRVVRAAVRSAAPTPRGIAGLVEEVERRLPDPLLKRLREWSRGKLNASERRLFAKVAGPMRPAAGRALRFVTHLKRMLPERLHAARQVLRPMLEQVEVGLRARGAMTFGALLAGAAGLLADRPDVRARVRRPIRQLLVDEFQDTDPVQCEIVRLLALDGPAERRPGLFVVGDPKQSIYGWRSADLVAYQGFVDEVEAAGGERLSLTVNRRSKQPILDEVERVVRPIMEADPGYQPAFVGLDAGREDAGDGPSGPWNAVEHWISWGWDPAGSKPRSNLLARATARLEGRALAADVARLERSGADLSRIALLLRSTGDLEAYLSSLRELGIPYVVERDRSYFRRREIIDVAALVRCVLEPSDHLALLTTLRSPAVGVPDAALIPLWRRKLPQLVTDLSQADPERLAAIAAVVVDAAAEVAELDVPGLSRVSGWPATLTDAIRWVGWLRNAWTELPSDEWVERLRTLLATEPTEAARYLGSYRAANLDRFFRRLVDALEQAAGDPQATLRLLRMSVAEAREAEEARPGDGQAALRVMTIHKSKGLDFDHVYVGQLHKQRRWGELVPANLGEATRARLVGGRWEYQLFAARTPGFDAVVRHEERVEICERVRLLYVSMTRAKERLVMLGSWDERPRAIPVRYARSMLELLGSREGGVPDLVDAMRAAAVAGEAGADLEDGVRLSFPGLRFDDAPDDRPRRVPPESELPSAAAVAAESAALLRARDAARARMARPVGVAASAEAHARSSTTPPTRRRSTPRLSLPRTPPAAPRASPPPWARRFTARSNTWTPPRPRRRSWSGWRRCSTAGSRRSCRRPWCPARRSGLRRCWRGSYGARWARGSARSVARSSRGSCPCWRRRPSTGSARWATSPARSTWSTGTRTRGSWWSSITRPTA